MISKSFCDITNSDDFLISQNYKLYFVISRILFCEITKYFKISQISRYALPIYVALQSPFGPAREILVLIALLSAEAQASLRKYADSAVPSVLA